MMRALGLDVCMPDFLNGRRRFDALEANRSHFISKILRDYLQIACALINAYRTTAISSFSNDDQIATKMLACLHEPNLLRTRINNEILHWMTNDASNIINFCVLTIDQIRVIIVVEKQGIVVAGDQEQGNSLTQLSNPREVLIDQLGTVYVADWSNNRIMRWPKGAKQGSVIVDGNDKGSQSNQLNYTYGLSFDHHGNLYVTEWENHRVQKFNIQETHCDD
ncbi:unnamed protein product [Rotaria sp. Silwood2]|nr:unnamed protein product [Rotaria sp. Silwood2]